MPLRRTMGETPSGFVIPKTQVSKPRLSASAVLSRVVNNSDEILLGHRVSEMPSFPDFWSFPGGGISKIDEKVGELYPNLLTEKGKDRVASIALLRELVEEIGLTPNKDGKMISLDGKIREIVCEDKKNWLKEFEEGNIIIEKFDANVISERVTPPFTPIRFQNRFFHVSVKNSDIGRLHYTSGSTGLPKGVVMSNEVLRERLFSFFATYEPEFSVNDTMLHVAPLTHAAGIWVIPCYMRGVKSIVLPHFDLDVLISSIEQYQVTQMMLVPTMMTRFVAAAERGNYNLSSLKVINYGTAPVPAETLVRGIRCLGKIFRQFYGMTECPQPIAIFRSTDHDIETKQGLRRLASCGKLAFNTSVVIRDENGQPVLEGEVGEITLKLQRQAATSYWRDPEMTALMQRDGWFYSGDLGRIDQEGYFYIVGRTKDMIISGGFNIYTREIENVLYSHPAVFEACVFGTPDPEWGETVTAAVIRKEGIQVTEKDLVDFCKNKIASFKKPRILYFVEELPKNHAGKFNKLKIRESFLAKNRFNVVIT